MKNSQRSFSLSKIISILVTVVLLSFLIFVGLVIYQDYLEDQCFKKVDASQIENPNQLMEISPQEKKELKIEQSLTPTKRFYEAHKCMQSKWLN